MERDIFDSIKEKEFSALTPEERVELSEVCATEFEYNQLKAVLSQVDVLKEKATRPRKETKAKLDDLFVQTYPKATPIWYNGLFAIVIPRDKPIYRQPLVQIAAVALIAFLTLPFLNQSITKESTPLAEVQTEAKKQKSIQSTENENAEDESNMDTRAKKLEEVVTDEQANDLSSEPVLVASAVTAPRVASANARLKDAATIPGSDHPDGIFMGGNVSFSQPASESPGIFDLLTTSF